MEPYYKMLPPFLLQSPLLTIITCIDIKIESDSSNMKVAFVAMVKYNIKIKYKYTKINIG